MEITMAERTVRVERIPGYPALRMIWSHEVIEIDMRDAFAEIHDELERTETPLYIHVEMRDSPMLMITRTVMSALKVYRHPKLEAWLVTGANDAARNIGGVLSAMTGRRNIHWMPSEDAVITYLREHTDVPS